MNTEEMQTAASGAEAPEVPVEVNVVELPSPIAVTVVDQRPFFTTPFDEYTVSEGLLLLVVLILFLNLLARALKEGFSWLT